MEIVLGTIDVKKSFKIRGLPKIEVLKGVNLSVKPGEKVAIIGRSGAGKSTLLNILGGLEKPTKGTVTVEAEGIESIRLINMMGQVLENRQGIHSNRVDLNLSGYAPSIYLVEIHTVYGTVKKRVTVCR